GGGALRSGAGEQVGALAERLAAPVLTTYMARGLLGTEHPCAVGLPPHLPAAGRLWDEADVVVAIGTDFDGMMTQNWAMPKPPKLVAINIDADDATKNYDPDVLLVGDAAEVTGSLVERVQVRNGLDHLRERLEQVRAEAIAELEREHPEEMKFLSVFAAAVPDDAVGVG